MSMRKCDDCHEVAWEDTMSSDGDQWWCKPCMDAAYAAAGWPWPEWAGKAHHFQVSHRETPTIERKD